MSFIKIILHCVWGTKNREPWLVKEKRTELIKYIGETAQEKNIRIDCINGYTDHLHALISLGPKQNVADIKQQLKGGSSFWINNKSKLFFHRFEWAEKYYAVSVSGSQLRRVRSYIYNQEGHHRMNTFKQECDEFARKYCLFEMG